MKQPKALVQNAADPEQVKNAKERERSGRFQELNDLRHVGATAEGRRVLWRLISKCRVHETIWDNSARIHYNAGQQDLGHFIMGEIAEADEELLFQMMRENKGELTNV